MNKLSHFAMSAALLAAIGCGKEATKPPQASNNASAPAAKGDEHSHGDAPHGGTIADWGGGAYHVEFTVDHDAKSTAVYILGDDAVTAAPVKAEKLLLTINEPAFQVELTPDPQTGETGDAASRFVGQHENLGIVREFAGTISGEVDGTPYAGDFKEVAGGHGHGHEHTTPHDGVVAALKGESGEGVGFVELKLHDDKGDLEAWLGKDRQMKEPFDLPAATVINVSFRDVPGKTAALGVRDNQRNEDEEGNANLRDGKTNYFIFPGDSGQDPNWLMGAKFKSLVELSFTVNGKSYTSEEFVLIPHTHADGQAHAH